MLKVEADHIITQCIEAYCVSSRYSSASGPHTFNQNPNAFDLDEMLKLYPQGPHVTTAGGPP